METNARLAELERQLAHMQDALAEVGDCLSSGDLLGAALALAGLSGDGESSLTEDKTSP